MNEGYVAGYEKLRKRLNATEQIVRVATKWSILLAVILVAAAVVSTRPSFDAFDETTWLALLVVLAVVSVFFAYINILVIASLDSTRNPFRNATATAAYIVTRLPSPGSDTLGYEYRDIHHLQEIAEIEQGSADWRSSFIQFTVVTTVAVLAWFAPLYFAMEGYTPDTAFLNVIEWWRKAGLLDRLPLIVAGVLIVVAALRLYNSLVEFYGGESANRTILLACADLIGLMELQGNTVGALSFAERKRLLELLGCRVVLERGISASDLILGDSAGLKHKDDAGDTWYTILPSRDSRLVSIQTAWRDYLETVRVKFKTLQAVLRHQTSQLTRHLRPKHRR